MIRKSNTTKSANAQTRQCLSFSQIGRAILFTILVCISLTSCSSIRYVEVPSSHSSVEVRMQYDSISRDHVRYMYLQGDTVHTVDSVFIDRWRVRADTVQKVDSIPVVVEVPVAGYMTKRQHFLYSSGITAWILFAIIALVFIIYIVTKTIVKR